MWAALAKIAIRFIPPDKAIKTSLGIIMGVLLFIGLLFAAPIVAFKHIPFAQSPDQFEYYSDAVKVIENETTTDYQSGVKLNWQQIMAIDAVLLEQDFDLSSGSRAIDMGWLFIREEEELIEKTCTRTVTKEDEDGEEYEEEEDYDCSYYITKYYAKSFDTVLNELVSGGLLDPSQIEDVKRYTLIDLSQLTEGVVLPPNWRPVIGDYAWPVPNVYRVTSTFGIRNDPFYGSLSVHDGLDVGADTGTSVVAIQPGKVIFAQERGTAGNAVIIKHDNDVQSRYYHLSKFHVTAGDVVEKGDIIGEVGSTGRSTGAHLHLEIHKSARPIDPLSVYQ